MAVNITRSKIQFDTSHGGTFQELHDDTGVPYVKGTNGNHSQKILEDVDNFNYDDETLDDTVSPATGKKLTVTNEHVTKDLEVDRDAFVHRDTEIDGNVLIHGRDVHSDPTSDLIPNVTNEGTLEQQDKAHFLDTVEVEKKTTLHYDPNDSSKQSLQVDGVANFDEDVYMNKNVYIKGTTYDTKTEDLLVGSDFVTLRDGYNGAMSPSEKAGILVNKYNGTDDLGIVARNDGTMTVGKFNTKHVYEKDGSYFEDVECTIAYTLPTGADLHSIGVRNPETGVQEFWFTVEDDTEPLTTRDEEELMEDEYLTKWNAADKNIVTSATNEARVVNSEIETKNDTARIYDLEHGKIDLSFTTSYPVEITKTPSEVYTQVTAGLNTFVSEKLVRCEKGTADNTDFTYEYKSVVPFYLKSGSAPDFIYTAITHWKKEDSVYYYSTDNRTTWISFNDPTIFYYQEGNGLPVEYEIEQDPESVIRHFDTAQDYRDEVAATQAGTSTNPLKVGNVIHIHDQLGIQTDVVGAQEILPAGAVGVSDRVELGNYDAVTSNAVAQAVSGNLIHGFEYVNDVNINANGRSNITVTIGKTLANTNYIALATVNSGTLGIIVENTSARGTTTFNLVLRNLNNFSVTANSVVEWVIFQY